MTPSSVFIQVGIRSTFRDKAVMSQSFRSCQTPTLMDKNKTYQFRCGSLIWDIQNRQQALTQTNRSQVCCGDVSTTCLPPLWFCLTFVYSVFSFLWNSWDWNKRIKHLETLKNKTPLFSLYVCALLFMGVPVEQFASKQKHVDAFAWEIFILSFKYRSSKHSSSNLQLWVCCIGTPGLCSLPLLFPPGSQPATPSHRRASSVRCTAHRWPLSPDPPPAHAGPLSMPDKMALC